MVRCRYDYDAPISEAGDYGQPGIGGLNKFQVALVSLMLQGLASTGRTCAVQAPSPKELFFSQQCTAWLYIPLVTLLLSMHMCMQDSFMRVPLHACVCLPHCDRHRITFAAGVYVLPRHS